MKLIGSSSQRALYLYLRVLPQVLGLRAGSFTSSTNSMFTNAKLSNQGLSVRVHLKKANEFEYRFYFGIFSPSQNNILHNAYYA